MGVGDQPIEAQAVEAIGLGFDMASDFRLRYAKGRERLVELEERGKRDIVVGSGVTVLGVPEGIQCDKGDQVRFKSDVLEFNQMSELLNQRSSIHGKVPSGYFNTIFDLSGSWLTDAADVKCLAFDGYFVALFNLQLTSSSLVLRDKVKDSVPKHWNPSSLARFIKTYGTHVIVGIAVGGQDILCVKQHPSSPYSPSELSGYLEDLGDCLYSDGTRSSLLERNTRVGKHKMPDVFKRILQPHTMQFTSITETSSKEGLTVIWSKRGGDVFSNSHGKWLQSVAAKPDAVLFKFVPITSLLAGIPGSGYLSHAINLYLRYKPALEDLQYFLEFQVPRQWAPLFCELPLRHHQRRKVSSAPLQFRFWGPKMHISSAQVSTAQKPVTGLRLFLEGKKSNRLAIHVQHLSSPPNTMAAISDNATSSTSCRWLGSDDYELSSQFFEPVNWKRYSKVCSTVVKHDPSWLQGDRQGGVFIVTGAQLVTKGKWPKNALHLQLLFTHLPNCSIRKTEWAAVPEASRKTGLLMNFSTTFTFTQKTAKEVKKQVPEALNSGVYPEGPPVPIRSTKLLKYVEIGEVLRGPHDVPGHWLVTAAKLVVESGKIGLHVKFALLDYDTQEP